LIKFVRNLRKIKSLATWPALIKEENKNKGWSFKCKNEEGIVCNKARPGILLKRTGSHNTCSIVWGVICKN